MNEDKQKTIDKILDLVSTGTSTAEAITKSGINRTTWYKWLKEDSTLANSYTRACEDRTEVYADRILEITQMPMPRTQKGDIDNAEVNNRRLQIDTIKWLMGKTNPKKYSDKAENNINATFEIKTTTVEYVNPAKTDDNSVQNN